MHDQDQSVADYIARLEAAMRGQGATASEIAEAGANVRERVAEAGESPDSIFGSADKHAARLAALEAPPTPVVRSIIRLVAVMAASWFGSGAFAALIRGNDSLGLPAVIPLVVCLAVIAVVVWDVRRTPRPSGF